MNGEHRILKEKRRTRAEIQQLVAEFMSSGMRRSEFCRTRGLSFGTLNRHLKKQRGKRNSSATSRLGKILPVELAAKKSQTKQPASCRLAVVLPGGRRIEVHPNFDTSTFERLVSALGWA